LKWEGKEKIANIKKTREYIEDLIVSEAYKEIPKENGEKLKRIIEGVNKGSEEERELLKLISEIGYKKKTLYIHERLFDVLIDNSGIKEYVKSKMEELVEGKEESKEREYDIIISYCLLITWTGKVDEKIIKLLIEFFKELKMDKINTIEEKKKRMKEIYAFECYSNDICLWILILLL